MYITRFSFAVVALVATVGLLVLRWVAFKVRVNGARLAIKQARRDFPNEHLMTTSVTYEGGKKHVIVQFSSGKSVKYLVVARDEVAIRVADR